MIFDGRPGILPVEVRLAMEAGIGLEVRWAAGEVKTDPLEIAITDATAILAEVFALDDDWTLVFTSSGTEAVNSAIKGAAWASNRTHGKIAVVEGDPDGFKDAAAWCERYGFCVDQLPLTDKGSINPPDMNGIISPETVMVALSSVTPEVFTRRELRHASKVCRDQDIPFIVDFSLQCTYDDIRRDIESADMFIIDGTALDAPPGSGILGIKAGVRSGSLISGGLAQDGRRGGRYPLHLLKGLTAALEGYPARLSVRRKQFPMLLEACREEIRNLVPQAVIPGTEDRFPLGLTIVLQGLEGEAVILALQTEGIYVSTGSGCLSTIGKPSAILTGMGVPEVDASGSIHLRFRDDHTVENVKEVIRRISFYAHKLWKLNGIIEQEF